MNERMMDMVKLEAEMSFMEMMAEFQSAWLGRRAEYGNQENNLPGEVGGQLVQRGGEDENERAEFGESEPLSEEAGGGSGDQSALMGGQLSG
jgi:hypothetical protein